MRKLAITVWLCCGVFSASFAQKVYSSKEDIYKADEFIFYGFDFTHFRIADIKRTDQNIKAFIASWTSYCQLHTQPEKMAVWFDKKSIFQVFGPTMELNNAISKEGLVTTTQYTIAADSISAMVEKYNLLEKEGIGFVVVEECFNKEAKTITSYYVFFDVATRKIIKSDYLISRDGNSYKSARDWSLAMMISLKNKYVPLYFKK